MVSEEDGVLRAGRIGTLLLVFALLTTSVTAGLGAAAAAVERTAGLGSAVLDWIYPPHCVHCGTPLAPAGRRILCAGCEDELRESRIVEPFCCTCGVPLPGGDECGLCRQGAQTFDAGRSLFSYAGPAGAIVRSYKYRGDYHLGQQVVERFVEPLEAVGRCI